MDPPVQREERISVSEGRKSGCNVAASRGAFGGGVGEGPQGEGEGRPDQRPGSRERPVRAPSARRTTGKRRPEP